MDSLTEKRTGTVLVVDDQPAVAETQAFMVKDLGYTALTQTDPEKVLADLARHPEIDLVMLDIRMPTLNGMDLLNRIKRHRPDMGVVMASVVNDIEYSVAAIKNGAYNYLLKPLRSDRLAEVLESYFTNQPRRLIQDPRFTAFITRSPVFEEIFRKIQVLAAEEVPVLIEGESGTGKELVARLIHEISPRRHDPLVAINVASFSHDLFESELFGYRRGAFTGAFQDHPGHFEQAGQGTLFLDEMGELADDHQSKLLRVLETRRYYRMGETVERELKARVVMATNCPLKEAVRRGHFREDLYL